LLIIRHEHNIFLEIILFEKFYNEEQCHGNHEQYIKHKIGLIAPYNRVFSKGYNIPSDELDYADKCEYAAYHKYTHNYCTVIYLFNIVHRFFLHSLFDTIISMMNTMMIEDNTD